LAWLLAWLIIGLAIDTGRVSGGHCVQRRFQRRIIFRGRLNGFPRGALRLFPRVFSARAQGKYYHKAQGRYAIFFQTKHLLEALYRKRPQKSSLPPAAKYAIIEAGGAYGYH